MRVVIQAWWLLAYFHLALRRVGFDQLQKQFTLAVGTEAASMQPLDFAWKMQKLVYLASRLHLLHMVCLERACTLQCMLSKRGIASDLRIGITRLQIEIYAHAWVEVAGHAIGEPKDIGEQFTSLNRI